MGWPSAPRRAPPPSVVSELLESPKSGALRRGLGVVRRHRRAGAAPAGLVGRGDISPYRPNKGATSMTRHIIALCGAMALAGLTASAQSSQQPASQSSMTSETVTATGCLKE